MTETVYHWGDSRDNAGMIQAPINCILTDPPYGMKFVSNFGQSAAAKERNQAIEGDDDINVALLNFTDVMCKLIPKLADDADLYIFGNAALIGPWKDAINNLPGIEWANLLIWNKGKPGMGDLEGNWANSYEVIHYAKKGRIKIAERRSSILSYDPVPPPQMIHPTEKPVLLLMELIKQSTQYGDLVVDPFAGSGATLDAARKLARRSIGFEINRAHYDRACKRFEQVLLDL